ncbi:MAG: PepSY domain-containing protein [Atopobiaceae bacterium]|nr:PepSY domain-containing protein [Atopobiaceae bacterium]
MSNNDPTIRRQNPRTRRPQMAVDDRRGSSTTKGVVIGVVATLAIVAAVAFGSGLVGRLFNRSAAAPQQQTTAQTTTQSTSQAPAAPEAQAEEPMLSEQEAINCAVAEAADNNNVRNAWAELKVGGDAPHYVVQFDFDDAHYTVTVDAYSGDVWDVQDSYSGEQASEEEEVQPVDEGADAEAWADEDVE